MQIAENEKWQKGDWEYNWNANGSLKSVKLPNGDLVQYEYDALGRRTKKIVNNKIIRYLWDNNVLLHEWEYDKNEAPHKVINKLGEISFDKPEPVQNLITWIYETGSFVPSAKIINNETFSIINDYIGRPILAFDSKGEKVWSCDYDIYGGLKNLKGDRSFIPFRQLGQYEDIETGLYYNRFRYYDPNTGIYISKDPIGLLGGFALYGYVKDVNSWVDFFGLSSFNPFEFGEITPFPKDLHFGQKRISPKFRDIGSEADDAIRGRTINDVSLDLSKGNIDPNIFQISYTKDPISGKFVTLNNRGLAALSESGIFPKNAIFVPFEKVPKYLTSDFKKGKIPSKSINVTENKDGTGFIRQIKNCN